MTYSGTPKALAFDLDSTLAESKSPVTPEMGGRLARLLETRSVAVMSGGAWRQFERQLLPALPKDTKRENLYLFPVSAGACFIFQKNHWTPVYDRSFLPHEKKLIMRALSEAMEETGFAEAPVRTWGPRIEDRGAQISFSGLGQEAPVAEKIAWDPDKKKRAPLQEALTRRLPASFIARMNATTTVDITHTDVSKAYGVRKFSELARIPIAEMLYVGDALFPGGNDEVVKATGIPTRQVAGPTETGAVIESVLAGPQSALHKSLAHSFKGDLAADQATLNEMSRDTSLFRLEPTLVAYPKDADDVSTLVRTIKEAKERGEDVSVTARAAGTDMSGGPLSRSVVAVFTRHMNKVRMVTAREDGGTAVVEPGCYYRDFEKETLRQGLLLPSYPASRQIAAMGGILNNNSGGERTLEYGKTERYVEEVEVVLSDGSMATFGPLSASELAAKQSLRTFEGEIYRSVAALIARNRSVIDTARPKVSKNSAGYALWDVYDAKRGTFNLAKLICGAQGTLALTTSMKLRLIRPEEHRAMLVIFLSDLAQLPEIVHRVLAHNPESFESYDDHTFKLAVKLLPQMLAEMGIGRALRLGLSFLPEVALAIKGGVPRLVLMAEFSRGSAHAAVQAAKETERALKDLKLPMRIARNEEAAEKYWIVRREAFAILRKKLPGLTAAPFIDDFVVPPDTYPSFLPKLFALLDAHSFLYAVTGHIGDGNFHIFPLLNMKKEESRKLVLTLAPQVYDLVLKYGGTTTGEHNDGIIRTPYLEQQFGTQMVELFAQVKNIFDPLNIFNPGKKVGGTFADIENSMPKGA